MARIQTEYKENRKETVSVLENKIFTNIVEKGLNENLPRNFIFLNNIAEKNNIDCIFLPFGYCGKDEDVDKVTSILTKYVNCN